MGLAAVMRDSNGMVLCCAADYNQFVNDSFYVEVFATGL
ncbi:hypothetical protein COLO4_06510 [Corchorus olitorius]|uniref:Uncharacterized protein n=1 Tax=Corchorus olitorius TaxID=93759 RepID=A0A1R3KMT6_9ROSI|nr:hypothetical protein COLO4_06510 [Corchorus olitorius]